MHTCTHTYTHTSLYVEPIMETSWWLVFFLNRSCMFFILYDKASFILLRAAYYTLHIHGGWYFINRSCKFFFILCDKVSFILFKGCILHITWLYVATLSSHHMSSNFPFYSKDDSPRLCTGHHGTWHFFVTIYGNLQPASLHYAALKLSPWAKNSLMRINKV